MIRWLTVIVGVGLAAAALVALLGKPPAPDLDRTAQGAPEPPPHEEIDDASRARLERVLREADAREERRR